jgi:hypothetical protein
LIPEGKPVLTRREFGIRLQRVMREAQVWAWVGFLGGAGWFVGFAVVARRMRLNAHPPLSYVFIAIWFGIAALILFGATLIGLRRGRTLGLCCPRCGKQLVGTSGLIAVASGRCGYCGEDVCA